MSEPKKKRPPRPDLTKGTPLQRLLHAALQQPKGKQTVVDQAGVSNRTVQWVLSGEYPRTESGLGPKPGSPDCSPRQLSGYVQALTRLALHLQADLPATLRDYGIDPDWPGVEAAIEKARHGRLLGAPDAAHRRDSVLARIERRDMVVRLGILGWAPWVKPNQKPEDSWAYKYSRRMVRSIDPTLEVESPPMEINLIQDVATAFQASDEKSALDLVFGAYDHPYRRRMGMDFVHLPGVGVPLAFLYGRSSDGTAEVTWQDILEPETSDLHIICIKYEVGHLFLGGAGGREPADVLGRSDTKFLAAHWVKTVHELMDGAQPRRPVFVADEATCTAIRYELSEERRWRELLPGPLRAKAADVDRIVQLTTLNATLPVPPSEAQSAVAPVFRLGVAVPAEATRWKELLDQVQREELFRNALPLTAANYVELLLSEPFLTPVSLHGELAPLVVSEFTRRVLEGIDRKLVEFKQRGFHDKYALGKAQRSRIAKVWTSPHEDPGMLAAALQWQIETIGRTTKRILEIVENAGLPPNTADDQGEAGSGEQSGTKSRLKTSRQRSAEGSGSAD